MHHLLRSPVSRPARRAPTLVAGLLLLAPLARSGDGGGPPLSPATEPDPAAIQEDQPVAALHRALLDGKWWLNLRLRYEDVDQDGIDKAARATTLRTVLGYESAPWHGLSALLEFEDVRAIPDSDLYNSTTNGVADRPIVADPEGTEVNQAFLRYTREDLGALRLGRQRIKLDNDRFVGNVGWRQNEQTFDAAALDIELPAAVDLLYAYVDNVNRVFGEQSPQGDTGMGSHLVHLQHEIEGWGTLSLYDYYLDYDALGFAALSTNSLGARFAGKHGLSEPVGLTYALEVAQQTDVGDNPLDVDVGYRLAELGLEVGRVSGKLGWETLEGDGTASFQTPLATLHAFNGWADKFLATPVDGLEDVYVQLGVKVGDGNLQAVYHDFSADEGGDAYGSEIDAAFTWPLREGVTLGVKLADYQADDFATDTRKAWLWLALSV